MPAVSYVIQSYMIVDMNFAQFTLLFTVFIWVFLFLSFFSVFIFFVFFGAAGRTILPFSCFCFVQYLKTPLASCAT